MINIAIDGPAGAGKSTIAKAVAKDLGIIYLDTGAMYRATAYLALQKGIDPKDEQKVSEMLEDLKMDIVYKDGEQRIIVNGIDATPYLREHYMSKAASDISALPCVRYKMVDLQRDFASKNDVVLDGRDIGTFVLPNANCKFFLTASPEERAQRRMKDLEEKGEKVDYQTLLSDIIQRDYNDSHRKVAPLKQADDADFVDTTQMSVEDVVAHVKEVVHIKTKNANPTEQNAEKPSTIIPSSKMDKKTLARIKTYYKPEKSFAFYRFLRVILRPIQMLVWPTKVIGAENAKKVKGALFTCNHYSKMDSMIPYFVLFKKEAHALAKYELFTNPVAGWFLHKMGAIPVRRGEADIESVKQVLRVLKDGKQLLIFPEGTRNKEGTQHMAEFKTGTARFAIKAKVPVVPMIYYQSPKAFRKNWLYVGEPFSLEEFYGARTIDENHAATEVIKEKMDETRRLCNEYVEKATKGKKKK
ncbi:MAG TPA: (d)CMP kinase [Clostridiales bacterium]|nr:(d)CMP kinase [Clostridiales bacterium]